jgi:hypothetical protein
MTRGQSSWFVVDEETALNTVNFELEKLDVSDFYLDHGDPAIMREHEAILTFKYNEKKYAVTCSRWNKYKDNIHSIGVMLSEVRKAAEIAGDVFIEKLLCGFRYDGTWD